MIEFLQMAEMIVLLVAAHFVCDYTLQTENQAVGKNWNIEKARHGVDWRYWMTSHAATHGVGVYLITQNVWLGVLETGWHFAIDAGKCEKGGYDIHIDQILHFITKGIIVFLMIT